MPTDEELQALLTEIDAAIRGKNITAVDEVFLKAIKFFEETLSDQEYPYFDPGTIERIKHSSNASPLLVSLEINRSPVVNQNEINQDKLTEEPKMQEENNKPDKRPRSLANQFTTTLATTEIHLKLEPKQNNVPSNSLQQKI